MFRAGLAATPFPDELPGQATMEPEVTNASDVQAGWPTQPAYLGLFWIQHLVVPPHPTANEGVYQGLWEALLLLGVFWKPSCTGLQPPFCAMQRSLDQRTPWAPVGL